MGAGEYQQWWEADVRIAHDDTRRAELADTTHAMNTGRHGYRLVAERREEVEEVAPDEQLLVAVPRTKTRFLCIATNDMGTSSAEVVAWYNRRQGASEQGNDRLKNDVCMGALPCRGAVCPRAGVQPQPAHTTAHKPPFDAQRNPMSHKHTPQPS